MDEQKKMFTNKSVTLFLVIVISVSAIFETIVIALRAMGLAVFLMWVPTIAAIIAGCISQKESNGKISFKKLLQSIGFQKTSIKWILLSCLIPAVYIGIPYVLFWIAFPNSLDMSKASVIQLVLMSVVGIFIGLITAIGEEIGWRGYLVPATLERVGIKKGTNIYFYILGCMALAYSYIRSVYAGNSRMVFCSGFSFYDYTCWNDLRNNNDKNKKYLACYLFACSS